MPTLIGRFRRRRRTIVPHRIGTAGEGFSDLKKRASQKTVFGVQSSFGHDLDRLKVTFPLILHQLRLLLHKGIHWLPVADEGWAERGRITRTLRAELSFDSCRIQGGILSRFFILSSRACDYGRTLSIDTIGLLLSRFGSKKIFLARSLFFPCSSR